MRFPNLKRTVQNENLNSGCCRTVHLIITLLLLFLFLSCLFYAWNISTFNQLTYFATKTFPFLLKINGRQLFMRRY